MARFGQKYRHVATARQAEVLYLIDAYVVETQTLPTEKELCYRARMSRSQLALILTKMVRKGYLRRTSRLMAAPIPFEPTSAPDPEIWPAHVMRS